MADKEEGEMDTREGEMDTREGEMDTREGEMDTREGEEFEELCLWVRDKLRAISMVNQGFLNALYERCPELRPSGRGRS